MGNYYREIHKMVDKLIYKLLVFDRKGFKIGTMGEELSLLEIEILRKIGEGKNKKIYELIEELQIERGWIAPSVQKLFANGYISKERSTEDKRVFSLNLTEQGEEILKKCLEEQRDVLNFILSDITLNEEKAILKFLSKINQITLRREKK